MLHTQTKGPTRGDSRTVIVRTLFAWLFMLLLLAGCDPYAPTSSETSTPVRTHVSSIEMTPTLMPVSVRLDIFDEVWQTVKDNYLYSDYHGVDWDALRREYRPKIETAVSATQFYSLTDEMVERLNDDHSVYISPWEAEKEDRAEEGDNNYVGIGILSFDRENSILIVDVFPNSPAAQAGLKRGDQIIAVDDNPFQKTEEDYAFRSSPEGTTVRFTVRSPSGPPREVTIKRHIITGGISPMGKRLDADPSIGYLVITTMDQQNMGEQVETELRELLDGENLKGLIIDLRGNGGGLISVLDQILSQFVTGEIGQDYSQKEVNPIEISKGDLYERLEGLPLVVLIDEGTESASELLAAGLQTKKRATVVGMPSAGNTESIIPYDFEDGSRLWLAEYGFRLPDGTNLEGKGVTPDVIVDVDWANYTERDDPQILKAIELIHK